MKLTKEAINLLKPAAESIENATEIAAMEAVVDAKLAQEQQMAELEAKQKEADDKKSAKAEEDANAAEKAKKEKEAAAGGGLGSGGRIGSLWRAARKAATVAAAAPSFVKDEAAQLAQRAELQASHSMENLALGGKVGAAKAGGMMAKMWGKAKAAANEAVEKGARLANKLNDTVSQADTAKAEKLLKAMEDALTKAQDEEKKAHEERKKAQETAIENNKSSYGKS